MRVHIEGLCIFIDRSEHGAIKVVLKEDIIYVENVNGCAFISIPISSISSVRLTEGNDASYLILELSEGAINEPAFISVSIPSAIIESVKRYLDIL